jgi:dsRNA-specific ribonuclease
MCKVNFVQEELPAALRGGEDDLRPDEHAHETFCQSVFLLQRYLFSQLMGIQPMHMFTKIFADPTRATGEPSQICGDYHVIPRFVAVNEEPLLNRQDLHAPNRMGFAVGRLLSVQKVLEYLEASTRFTVKDYFSMFDHRELVDCVVTTRINGIPGAFRVDAVNVRNTSEESEGDSADAIRLSNKTNGGGEVRTKDGNSVVATILHRGESAHHYDGAKSERKIREWRKQGEFLQLSPEVDAHTLPLNMLESHLTGLRTDIFEVGTAMPMILKHIRHCNLLSSFEDSRGVRFNDKALLRQAFTHGSFVDVGMQSVNTVEATTARVRLAHLFENTASLKRSRSMAFREDEAVSSGTSSRVEREIQKVAEKHLSGDFKQEFHSRFLCPYERLEFLGDAVLSFLVASAAFLKLPEAHEGDLHQTRVDLTNNETLGQIARTANFESLLLSAFDLTKLKEGVTLKIIADCFEALLGALFKDQGIAPCRELLGKLMDMHDPELRDLCFLSTAEVIEESRKYVEIDRTAIQSAKKYSMMRLTHRRFVKRTGVDVANTHLWLQAVTHPSFMEPQIDADEFICHDPNYERIEFLGDAVLQVLSSEFLVEAFPYHQEHLLTQARSSLVKNTRLAVVAREAGYEDFIRLGNQVRQNGNLYVEDVLADVFEATLGAVFLENPSSLDPARDILTKTVFPRLTEVRSHALSLSWCRSMQRLWWLTYSHAGHQEEAVDEPAEGAEPLRNAVESVAQLADQVLVHAYRAARDNGRLRRAASAQGGR